MKRASLSWDRKGQTVKLNPGAIPLPPFAASDLPVEVLQALQTSKTGSIEVLVSLKGLSVTSENGVLALRLAPQDQKSKTQKASVSSEKSGSRSSIATTDFDKERVYFAIPIKKKRQGRVTELTSDATTQFQVTDQALGLQKGNQFRLSENGELPGHLVTRFGPQVPVVAGEEVSIDRNPYNFVAFAGAAPWEDPAPQNGHAGHDGWQNGRWCGSVTFSLEAKTPIFVPEGYPFISKLGERDGTSRRFCRLRKADGKLYYAIPGSSLKGPLRAMVEA
jgi:hypothetical protein